MISVDTEAEMVAYRNAVMYNICTKERKILNGRQDHKQQTTLLPATTHNKRVTI